MTITQTLNELKTEIKKGNPEPTKISKLFTSLKKIFEGATGNIVAQGIIASINKIDNIIF